MIISTEDLLKSDAHEKYEIRVVTDPECDCGWKKGVFENRDPVICPKCKAEIWVTRVWEKGCLCIINERQI